ncbi:UNKNOWN [Stylonychia lemnae]|uniref:Uncharacterized protein n=1 Tax=Stylonychia lemnae TaxID=5949 RepID=A0A078AFN8_STYLE|nr:UNKNOWN [Stylonychia lemnae]|eukprot:CDW80317.1 UNKNOWN [Stylonychia lemnae]
MDVSDKVSSNTVNQFQELSFDLLNKEVQNFKIQQLNGFKVQAIVDDKSNLTSWNQQSREAKKKHHHHMEHVTEDLDELKQSNGFLLKSSPINKSYMRYHFMQQNKHGIEIVGQGQRGPSGINPSRLKSLDDKDLTKFNNQQQQSTQLQQQNQYLPIRGGKHANCYEGRQQQARMENEDIQKAFEKHQEFDDEMRKLRFEDQQNENKNLIVDKDLKIVSAKQAQQSNANSPPLYNVAKVNMNFNGLNINKRTILGNNRTFNGDPDSSYGTASIGQKLKMERINPIIYLTRKRQEQLMLQQLRLLQQTQSMDQKQQQQQLVHQQIMSQYNDSYNYLSDGNGYPTHANVATLRKIQKQRGKLTFSQNSPSNHQNKSNNNQESAPETATLSQGDRRIINLQHLTQSIQQPPQGLQMSETSFSQFEQPPDSQMYISQGGLGSKNNVGTDSMSVYAKMSGQNIIPQKVFQAQSIYPILDQIKDKFLLPLTSRSPDKFQTTPSMQSSKINTSKERLKSTNIKTHKYLNHYQQKLKLDRQIKSTKGKVYVEDADIMDEQQERQHSHDSYQTLEQREKSPPDVNNNNGGYGNNYRNRRNVESHSHQKYQQIPMNMAILPPLKSRDISPRYNLSFKHHHGYKIGGHTPPHLHRESEEIKQFLNHKMQNEGGLNFVMPGYNSFNIDNLNPKQVIPPPVEQTISNPNTQQTTGQGSGQGSKDLKGKYHQRKRRSSTSYAQTLLELTQNTKKNIQE